VKDADREFAAEHHDVPSHSGVQTGELAANAHRLRVDNVEVVVADLGDVIRSKETAGRPKDLRVLPILGQWVPKTCATWADALGIAVGSVKRLGVGRAGLGSAGGGMIFGLWA